ncbi:hypothetical protein E1B28_006482 [Marasmius oreades]|uniref:Aquaporin n=1 Tax=Marasmius oreades TaxID=181124 RepID=A0A9P7UVL8_9AGAR|nr:uncharacterized protein E1B28_006482 [Marasmius oreades]KAG7095778.1 hypothetical protein E1B28_006482 [Marasmius oreades]
MSNDITYTSSSSDRIRNESSSPTKSPIESSDHRDIPTMQRKQRVPQNWWWKYRMMIREAAAEFTAVMLLVIFGSGVNCQVGLSSNTNVSASPKGDYLSVSFGWAVGLALGVWVSAGISGGHVNPAVTLSMAIFRGFPWRKVPVYMISQLLGGIVGAAIVYANYFHAIDIVEGGRGVRTLATAGFFGTFAAGYMTNVSCFFAEFLATAILLLVILAVTDKRNCPPPYGMLPLVIFVVTLGIAACLGMETGFAMNPARDFGPRILTSMVGYGSAVYTFRNHYWIWCPIMAPFLGAMAGTCFYDILMFTGEESVFNRSGAQTPGIMDHEADDAV